MPDFIPDPATLLAYSVACFILFITPGPDMSFMLARTIGSGRSAGVAAVAGTTLGACVHTLAAALGISALIAASATAFGVLKVVGAVYLAWLAFDAIRNGSSLNVRASAPTSVRRSFWMALTVNLTNPKVVLFFVTFLPQFVSAHDPHAAAKLAFLGLFFVVGFNVPLSLLLVLGAERVVGALKARPKVLRGIDWLFATIFGAFAVRILTAEAR